MSVDGNTSELSKLPQLSKMETGESYTVLVGTPFWPKRGRPRKTAKPRVKKTQPGKRTASVHYRCSFNECRRRQPYKRLHYFLRHLRSFHKMSTQAVEDVRLYVEARKPKKEPGVNNVHGYKVLLAPTGDEETIVTKNRADSFSSHKSFYESNGESDGATDDATDTATDDEIGSVSEDEIRDCKLSELEQHDLLALPKSQVSSLAFENRGLLTPIEKPVLTKRPHSFSEYNSCHQTVRHMSEPVNGSKPYSVDPYKDPPAKKQCENHSVNTSRSSIALSNPVANRVANRVVNPATSQASNTERTQSEIPLSEIPLIRHSVASTSHNAYETYPDQQGDLSLVLFNMYDPPASTETTEIPRVQYIDEDENYIPDLDYYSNVSTNDCSFEETYPEVCNIEMDLQLDYADMCLRERTHDPCNDWYIPLFGDPRISNLSLP